MTNAIGLTVETTMKARRPVYKNSKYTIFFIRNLARGLVLKVPYFRTSFYQILVLKVP